MEKMLVAVFDEESQAYEGWRVLKQLDEQGIIVVYAARVIGKDPHAAITVKHSDFEFPLHAVSGTAIGALIGLLAGAPLGVIGGTAVGSVAGGLTGSVPDFYRAEVNAEFLNEVCTALQPGKFAVIADINEESVGPVDIRMAGLGGTVIRTVKQQFEAAQRAKAVAELRAEIEQTKAEFARAHAVRKAELQTRLDRLNAQFEAQLDQAKQRSEEIRIETEARLRELQRRAEIARADLKASLNAQAKQVAQDYEETQARLKGVLAYAREQLEIHEREIQGIRILDLYGHIVAGPSEARLRERITTLTEAGAANVILNCDCVMDIDADGLTCLKWCSATIRYAGGALKLLKVRWDHMDLIARAGLGKEFEIFSDEVSALNSFYPERAVPAFDVLEYAKQQRKEASDRVT